MLRKMLDDYNVPGDTDLTQFAHVMLLKKYFPVWNKGKDIKPVMDKIAHIMLLNKHRKEIKK